MASVNETGDHAWQELNQLSTMTSTNNAVTHIEHEPNQSMVASVHDPNIHSEDEPFEPTNAPTDDADNLAEHEHGHSTTTLANNSDHHAEYEPNQLIVGSTNSADNQAEHRSHPQTIAPADDEHDPVEHEPGQSGIDSTDESIHPAEHELNRHITVSTDDAGNRAEREPDIRSLPVSQVHAEIPNLLKRAHEPFAHDDDSDSDSEFESEVKFAEKLTYQKQFDREQDRMRKAEEDALFTQMEVDDEEQALFLTDDEAPDDEASTLDGHKRNRQACDEDYDDDSGEPTSKRRKKSGAARRGRPKGSKNKNKTSKNGKKTTARAPLAFDADRILGSNAIGDYASVEHLPSQPTLASAKSRKEAFKKLWASVPIAVQKEARSDTIRLDDAMKAFAGDAFPPGQYTAQGALMKGMKSPLKHYQVIGAGFMREQEEHKDPCGGILADEMGLGKTVMVLANIVNGKRARETYNRVNKTRPGFQPLPRPTLIVVPASLLHQWQDEVEKHVHFNPETKKRMLSAEQNAGLHKVADFYSLARQVMKGETLIKKMQDHDIVFTTYTALQKSFPKMEAPKELTTTKQKEAWYKERFNEFAGPLHKVNWLRVVLDEAHYIKNHLSHTSKACRWLQARYHWAITATPVQNRLEEFYPYLKFVRHPLVSSMRQFTANCCGTGFEQLDDADEGPGDTEDDESAVEDMAKQRRLLAILSTCMIRRTLNDQMFGAKLIDVPKPEEPFLMQIEFTPVERAVYNILRQKFLQQVNDMVQAGTIHKELKTVFTMVLRLRQATDHILLLHDVFVHLADRGDLEDLRIAISQVQSREDGLRNMMELRYMLDVMKPMIAEQHGSCKIVTQAAHQATNDLHYALPDFHETSEGGLHGFTGFDYSKYINSLGEGTDYAKLFKQTRCVECNEIPQDAHITACKHIYCKDCLQGIADKAARMGKDGALCSKCSDQFVSSRKCFEGELPDATEDGTSNDPAVIAKEIAEKDYEKYKAKKKSAKMNSWLKMNGPVAPSAKTMAMKTQVLKWISEDKDVKIIVYSQFVQFLDILKRVCVVEKWEHRCFKGDMNLKARDAAIADFKDPNKGVQILLTSLKCGSLGLNLTAASRVLLMESWWNASVEAQAFGRVLRPGQEKTTSMTRLMVRNTIDEALLHMKQRKSGEIDGVMREESEYAFDLPELMSLFRPLDADGNETSYIVAEDDGNSGDNLDRFVDPTQNDEYESMHNDH